VSFDPYQVGPYAAGPREVHIPLAEVQPMLSVVLSPAAFSLVLEAVP
ncbi:MAG: RsiV family protein, partial [Candidatus Cryosericum sp.]